MSLERSEAAFDIFFVEILTTIPSYLALLMMAIILSSYWCSWRIVFVYDFVVSINDAHVIKATIVVALNIVAATVGRCRVLCSLQYVMFDARSEEVLGVGCGGMMCMNVRRKN